MGAQRLGKTASSFQRVGPTLLCWSRDDHVRASLDFQAQCVQGTLCQAGLKQAERGVREKEFGLGVRLSWVQVAALLTH